jgi:hypothetical protein
VVATGATNIARAAALTDSTGGIVFRQRRELRIAMAVAGVWRIHDLDFRRPLESDVDGNDARGEDASTVADQPSSGCRLTVFSFT